MTNSRTSATLLIIKYLLNNNNYNKYNRYINKENISTIEKVLYKYLHELHEEFGRDISVEEYSLYVLNHETDADTFGAVLDNLSNIEVDDELIIDVLEESRLRKEAHQIALVAIDVAEGKKEFPQLIEVFDNVDMARAVSEEIPFVTDDLEILYQEQYLKPGLRWRLNTLNRVLGSLRLGDFGFIFARPETGKTTFLASEGTYMAEQIKAREEGPLIWFNNEEEGKKVKLRMYQALFGATLPEIFRDRTSYAAEFEKRLGGSLRLYDSASISRGDVESVIKECSPSAIIFDQIDAITGFTGDRDDLRLGNIYAWARELGKTYGPTIGVCQSDGTGEGKKWLNMDNVALAKTAKQATADWILGIGKVHDDGYDYVRYLHASKNKLQGDPDTVPELRHGKVEVIIQPEIARYADFTR